MRRRRPRHFRSVGWRTDRLPPPLFFFLVIFYLFFRSYTLIRLPSIMSCYYYNNNTDMSIWYCLRAQHT